MKGGKEEGRKEGKIEHGLLLVMVCVDCKFDRIYNHPVNKPLSTSGRMWLASRQAGGIIFMRLNRKWGAGSMVV